MRQNDGSDRTREQSASEIDTIWKEESEGVQTIERENPKSDERSQSPDGIGMDEDRGRIFAKKKSRRSGSCVWKTRCGLAVKRHRAFKN